jgi:hypothetical protein
VGAASRPEVTRDPEHPVQSGTRRKEILRGDRRAPPAARRWRPRRPSTWSPPPWPVSAGGEGRPTR